MELLHTLPQRSYRFLTLPPLHLPEKNLFSYIFSQFNQLLKLNWHEYDVPFCSTNMREKDREHKQQKIGF